MQEMDTLGLFVTICIVSFTIMGSSATIFDVVQYGAVGNGKTYDTEAFLRAWQDFCSDSTNSPILKIPAGKTFLLGPVNFQGPCRSSNPNVQILGNLVAPIHLSAWKKCVKKSWIVFSAVNGLIVDGSGQIDGRGSFWWKKGIKSPSCGIPSGLRFFKCNKMKLSGLHHVNPPKNHISIDLCNTVTINNLNIIAPQFSPNTDGIDISSSTNIQIQDLNIQTGDDCIAINSGSAYINITRVACGPGHGISIGSLGKHGSYDTVEQVYVDNCNFTGTTNGCRIKTWPGGRGYARHISFNQIRLNGVKNPIVIDEHYCHIFGVEAFCKEKGKAVEISNVAYKNIKGTSASKVGIKLDCSSHVRCVNITMEHIGISGDGVYATCNNAKGTAYDTSPIVPCLVGSTSNYT